MKELKENFQLCYFAPQNAKGVAMNLLTFGVSQFQDTFLYKNQEKLRLVCENYSNKLFNYSEIEGFIRSSLIDAIKIHICFENFLKAIFLINEVIIHQLDKSFFPDLHKKQKKEPVYKFELLKIAEWEEDSRINLSEVDLRKQIKGVLKRTLGTGILMGKNYLERIGLTKEVADIIKPYFEYRNNLHYYIGESFVLSKNNYNNFRKIVDFINKNIVRLQNIMVDELEKGDNYKIKKI